MCVAEEMKVPAEITRESSIFECPELEDRYLRFKKFLADIVNNKEDINSTNDIEISVVLQEKETNVCFKDCELREVFDKIHNISSKKMAMVSDTMREIPVRCQGYRFVVESDCLPDDINNITYSLGPASYTYCIFLLDRLLDELRDPEDYANFLKKSMRHRRIADLGFYLGRPIPEEDLTNVLVSFLLQVTTVKTVSSAPISANKLEKFSASYEFLWMYKFDSSLVELDDLYDVFPHLESKLIHRSRFGILDTPPRRFYNADVMDYYAMALESRDPFTRYISFYHVIEFYFDRIYNQIIIAEVRDQINHPDFSYKNDKKIKQLVDYIGKKVKDINESGRGNEKISLQYVLEEYVSGHIDKLKERIGILDSEAIKYYEQRNVPFILQPNKQTEESEQKNLKIGWNDTPKNICGKIASRVYLTRNALVHSKSDQVDCQYRPYRHRKYLKRELPLIQAIAEQILIESSDSM